MANEQSYVVSESFRRFIIQSAQGFINPKLIESFFSSIEIEAEKYKFNATTESNLIRIISSAINRNSFIGELIKYPFHLEVVMAIAGSSNFLTDVVVRNPEYIYTTFDSEYLKNRLTKKILSNEIKNINTNFNTYSAKSNRLRSLKSRCILKIGLRDIMGIDNFEDTVDQISITANEILKTLFENSYAEILKKYNIKSSVRKYCLCSLGKLGGRELNYSSDVDLILFFDKNSKMGREKRVEYYQVLSEATQLFIQTASEFTAGGHLYRIDFRLRPDGKNAPLCRTLADYERYYETRAEDWERQMLIKLDMICGSKSLFNMFHNYISHYVYPASFSVAPVVQIAKMKLNIEKKLQDDRNVKLFSGGMRDIEFAVQALQLINGGKYQNIRTGNTLEALKQLKINNLINSEEKHKLKQAYLFYRKIEHFLQLLNDTQTHSIPGDTETKKMMLKYLKIHSINDFENIMLTHRREVSNIFFDIIGADTLEMDKKMYKFELFKDKQRAINNFNYLSKGLELSGTNHFDSKTIALFEKIRPALFNYLNNSNWPDRVIENFVKFMRISDMPWIWYREFSDEKFFKKVLRVCEFSDFSIELISNRKELAELFISRKVFIKDIEQNFHNLSINEILLILSTQYTLGLLDNFKISLLLSKYVLDKITSLSSSIELNSRFFIAAMGSLGSKSITFKSDIDLIFVVENLKDYEKSQNEFQKFLNVLKRNFPTFDVDCRLRPEGNKSPLVWDLDGYSNYLKSRARVWEVQSLLKSGFICGDKKLYNLFAKIIHNKIKSIDHQQVKIEMVSMIKSMRGKHNSIFLGTIDIKNGWGSITYINFIIAYILLTDASLAEKLRGKSIWEKIQYLCKYNEQKSLFCNLKNNYQFLKNLELSLQNCLNKRNSILPNEVNGLDLIAFYNKTSDIKNFIKQIGKMTRFNSETFESLINSEK